MLLAVRSMRSKMSSRTPLSKVRMVPIISHLVGNDVEADAALDGADADDRRHLRDVDLPADDGLQAQS